MEKETKEQSQAQQLQELVDTWSAIQKYSFYVGCQRGILSSINTVCLRFAGLTFEEYTKRMIKPQLNQMMTCGQCITLLAGLLDSVGKLVDVAMAEAQQDVNKEKENEENTKSSSMAQ